MIKRLFIENYVLIRCLDIQFEQGLNIVTGETGAGKSILLGAMSLLLGGRADGSVMKEKQENCIVEGVFDISGYGLESLFDENDLEYHSECTIRRVISPSGKSRAYVNDLPAPLPVLKKIGERLIDIHSQHETLLLGDSGFQMEVLDGVGGCDEILGRYIALYKALKERLARLNELEESARRSKADEAYIRYQYDQLADAKLTAGEQAVLEAEQKTLSHAAEIKEAFYTVTQIFSGDDNAVIPGLKTAFQALQKCREVFPPAAGIADRIESCRTELKDIDREAAGLYDKIGIDPEKLAHVDQRLDLLYGLEQKHAVQTVEELIAVMEQYKEQLHTIDSYEEQLSGLKKEIETLRSEAEKAAATLSGLRKKNAPVIEKQVTAMLRELGMPSSNFHIELSPSKELLSKGADVVRFMFNANKGGLLQPIEKAASGGEMSRLMLALKSLMATHSKMPSIIFDEIDAGVSGAVADKMGEIIARLSGHLQIINITHLPQVASKGKHHFFVYKENRGDSTHTHIAKLSDEERIREIAKMLSGTQVTNAAVEQAKALLGEA